MQSIKKITICFIIVIFMLATSFGIITLLQNFATGKQVKATTAATDITQLTPEEQQEVNNKILTDWGTPTSDKFIALNSSITNNTIATTGDYWYYLTQDITTTNWNDALKIVSGHVRILLNGYSISNDFRVNANGTNVIFSIFDKIPNKNEPEYKYNPNSDKYYTYNETTKMYDQYSTTKPTGVDVTSLPTWTTGTYIKVTGSAISPNEAYANTSNVLISATNGGSINVYGINFVGCTGYSSIFILSGQSALNAYQCSILGNTTHSSGWSVVQVHNAGTLLLNSCSIYGNRQKDNTYGVQPSNTNLPYNMGDIIIVDSGTLTVYKCNIGVLIQANYTNWNKVVYLKDVDFGQIVTIMGNTFESNLQTLNGVSGSIELIYQTTLNFSGNSPNLNFIVHGKNTKTAPFSGYNNLNIVSGATVKSIQISGTLEIEADAHLTTLERTNDEGKLIDHRENQTTGNATDGSTVIIRNNATVQIAILKDSNFKGRQLSMALASIQLEYTSIQFNNEEHRPNVKISLDGTELTKDIDYTVEYSNNIEVGVANVTVKGMGNYIGSRTVTFTIVNVNTSSGVLEANSNNGIVYIILGVSLGLLVLIAIAVVLILLFKKKAKNKDKESL